MERLRTAPASSAWHPHPSAPAATLRLRGPAASLPPPPSPLVSRALSSLFRSPPPPPDAVGIDRGGLALANRLDRRCDPSAGMDLSAPPQSGLVGRRAGRFSQSGGVGFDPTRNNSGTFGTSPGNGQLDDIKSSGNQHKRHDSNGVSRETGFRSGRSPAHNARADKFRCAGHEDRGQHHRRFKRCWSDLYGVNSPWICQFVEPCTCHM